ncbi:MAG: undecaprenyl/decaprenyl-phosphate alpha-N-acetylglucosaminyl 1-phosphate transferase [Actinobacteria bacterium]|nr:MAG: undecaprenyl/decaprenyl-phosphate alpha-N-acetylglucosaminyl 1-phosphate transferase [Actinomycetota bacterium]
MNDISKYLLLFAIGMVATYLATPVVEKVSLALGLVDVPEKRKVHREPVPRLGGVAIFFGFLVALGFQILAERYLPWQRGILSADPELAGILLAAAIIFGLGVIDDIRDISPPTKLAGQLGAGVVVLAFGVSIEFIGNPFGAGGLLYLGVWSIPLTLFWMTGFANTVNFIDGLDGLAAGVCAISGATFFVFAVQTGQTTAATLSAVFVAVCIGFLKHNFHPARIIMGDSGSMFLGFMLGAIAIQGVMKSIAAIALLVPILIMGVPIFDTAFAIARRMKNRQPITGADRGHIHHRLLHKGFSHRLTVIVIYIWSGLLAAAGWSLKFAPSTVKYSILGVLAALSFLMLKTMGIFQGLRRSLRLNGRGAGEARPVEKADTNED